MVSASKFCFILKFSYLFAKRCMPLLLTCHILFLIKIYSSENLNFIFKVSFFCSHAIKTKFMFHFSLSSNSLTGWRISGYRVYQAFEKSAATIKRMRELQRAWVSVRPLCTGCFVFCQQVSDSASKQNRVF